MGGCVCIEVILLSIKIEEKLVELLVYIQECTYLFFILFNRVTPPRECARDHHFFALSFTAPLYIMSSVSLVLLLLYCTISLPTQSLWKMDYYSLTSGTHHVSLRKSSCLFRFFVFHCNFFLSPTFLFFSILIPLSPSLNFFSYIDTWWVLPLFFATSFLHRTTCFNQITKLILKI